MLHASLLARTTSVVRNRSAVFNRLDVQASGLKSRDRAFSARTRTIDANGNIFHTKLGRLLSRLLRGTLTGKWRTLATPLKPTRAGTCPTECIPFCIGNRHRCVIECRSDMDDTHCHITPLFSFFTLSHRLGSPSETNSLIYNCCMLEPTTTENVESQSDYFKSLTPFLPATVFLGPLRVRALVRVRCPRTGNPCRCRNPR